MQTERIGKKKVGLVRKDLGLTCNIFYVINEKIEVTNSTLSCENAISGW